MTRGRVAGGQCREGVLELIPFPLYYGLVNAPYFVLGSLMTAAIIELIG